MHRGILDDAVTGANLLADLLPERLLFSVGDLKTPHVVRLLGDADALADSAGKLPSAFAFGYGATRPIELRGAGLRLETGYSDNHDQKCQLTHHVGLTSYIATGRLLPFTMTSPRGWIS
jgi:hypothetical protein